MRSVIEISMSRRNRRIEEVGGEECHFLKLKTTKSIPMGRGPCPTTTDSCRTTTTTAATAYQTTLRGHKQLKTVGRAASAASRHVSFTSLLDMRPANNGQPEVGSSRRLRNRPKQKALA